MNVLVVNAGSSSLKLRLLDGGDGMVASADLPAPGGSVDTAALEEFVDRAGPVDAVGHRIVHGGVEFVEPVLLDPSVVERLHGLTDLAPLHQPKSLSAYDEVSRVLPGVPAVGCFDTAFHAHLPAAASTYALPPQWRSRWNLKRYGFHGLSHAYASRRACEQLSLDPAGLRIVTCHLGAGASLAAVLDGRSLDTTMGFTPLEGLVMATRSGSVDPGLVLWLEEHVGTPPSELAATLEHRSGLLGLAGTADMREIVERSRRGEPEAELAFGVYQHRLRAGIAAMAAALDGLDVLVFTGGVGERAPHVRACAADGLGFLGVRLDAARNDAADGDCEIGARDAGVRAIVIESREDLEIAGQTRRVLAPPASVPSGT